LGKGDHSACNFNPSFAGGKTGLLKIKGVHRQKEVTRDRNTRRGGGRGVGQGNKNAKRKNITGIKYNVYYYPDARRRGQAGLRALKSIRGMKLTVAGGNRLKGTSREGSNEKGSLGQM